MLNKKLLILASATLLFSIAAITLVSAKPAGLPRGSAYIYVTGQDKFYDTIVPISQEKGLPWNPQNTGSFQQLIPDAGGNTFPGISETPVGPGDPGYRGGRWWIDDNGNGYQDADDIYFLCPLLGPSRDAV